METVKTDILIIGAGAAGSMAAIKASDHAQDMPDIEKAKDWTRKVSEHIQG